MVFIKIPSDKSDLLQYTGIVVTPLPSHHVKGCYLKSQAFWAYKDHKYQLVFRHWVDGNTYKLTSKDYPIDLDYNCPSNLWEILDKAFEHGASFDFDYCMYAVETELREVMGALEDSILEWNMDFFEEHPQLVTIDCSIKGVTLYAKSFFRKSIVVKV